MQKSMEEKMQRFTKLFLIVLVFMLSAFIISCTTYSLALETEAVTLEVNGEAQIGVELFSKKDKEANDKQYKKVEAISEDESKVEATVEGKFIVIKAIASGEVIVNVEYKKETVPITVTVSGGEVIELSITGLGEVQVGKTIQLTANKDVTWASSNLPVATINANGLVTGVSAGETTITATTAGGESKTHKVVVSNEPVQPLEITGTTFSVEVGKTITLSTNKGAATWSSADVSIATVGASTGIVTGVKDGKVVITATVGGQTATKEITVTAVAVVDLDISGPSTVQVGSTINLTVNKTGTASWSSADDSIATVSSSGVVTGVKDGKVVISVTVGSETATKEITVTALPVVPATGVTISNPPEDDMPIGSFVQLEAIVLPAGATDKTVEWEVDDESVATIVDGLLTIIGMPSNGIVVVTVYVSANKTLKDTCEVVVVNAEPEDVEISAPSITINVNQTLQLTAEVLPAGASQFVSWSVESGSSIASVSSSGLVTPSKTAIGEIVVRAIAKVGVYDEITITIVWAPGESVVIKDGQTPITTYKLNLTDSKQLGFEVLPAGSEQIVTWSSDDEGKVTVVNGLIYGVSTGKANIKATAESGVFITVEVEVVVPAAEEVTISGDGYIFLDQGDTIELSAVVGPVGAPQAVEWESDDEEVATVDEDGVVTVLKAGVVVITASVNGTDIESSFKIQAYATQPTVSTTTALVTKQEVAEWHSIVYAGTTYYGGQNVYKGLEEIVWVNNLVVEVAPGEYNLTSPIRVEGKNITINGPYKNVAAKLEGRGDNEAIINANGVDFFGIVGGSENITLNGLAFIGRARIGTAGTGTIVGLNFLNLWMSKDTGASGGGAFVSTGSMPSAYTTTTTYHKDVVFAGCVIDATNGDRVLRLLDIENLTIVDSRVTGGVDLMLLSGSANTAAGIGLTGMIYFARNTFGGYAQYGLRFHRLSGTAVVVIEDNDFISPTYGIYPVYGTIDFGTFQRGAVVDDAQLSIIGNRFWEGTGMDYIGRLRDSTSLENNTRNAITWFEILYNFVQKVDHTDAQLIATSGTFDYAHFVVDTLDNSAKGVIDYNVYLNQDGTALSNLKSNTKYTYGIYSAALNPIPGAGLNDFEDESKYQELDYEDLFENATSQFSLSTSYSTTGLIINLLNSGATVAHWNSFWSRIFLKWDANVGAYEIVKSGNGASIAAPAVWDVVIAVHDTASDVASRTYLLTLAGTGTDFAGSKGKYIVFDGDPKVTGQTLKGYVFNDATALDEYRVESDQMQAKYDYLNAANHKLNGSYVLGVSYTEHLLQAGSRAPFAVINGTVYKQYSKMSQVKWVEGMTLNVGPGTYGIDLQIVNHLGWYAEAGLSALMNVSNTKMVGPNAGIPGDSPNRGPEAVFTNIIRVGIDGFFIENITIDGIRVQGPANSASTGAKIQTRYAGIGGVNGLTVQNSYFSVTSGGSGTQAAIWIDSDLASYTSRDINVIDNYFVATGPGRAVQLFNVTNATITGNTFKDFQADAIRTEGALGTSTASGGNNGAGVGLDGYVNISNNTFDVWGQNAIRVGKVGASLTLVVDNNIFKQNGQVYGTDGSIYLGPVFIGGNPSAAQINPAKVEITNNIVYDGLGYNVFTINGTGGDVYSSILIEGNIFFCDDIAPTRAFINLAVAASKTIVTNNGFFDAQGQPSTARKFLSSGTSEFELPTADAAMLYRDIYRLDGSEDKEYLVSLVNRFNALTAPEKDMIWNWEKLSDAYAECDLSLPFVINEANLKDFAEEQGATNIRWYNNTSNPAFGATPGTYALQNTTNKFNGYWLQVDDAILFMALGTYAPIDSSTVPAVASGTNAQPGTFRPWGWANETSCGTYVNASGTVLPQSSGGNGVLYENVDDVAITFKVKDTYGRYGSSIGDADAFARFIFKPQGDGTYTPILVVVSPTANGENDVTLEPGDLFWCPMQTERCVTGFVQEAAKANASTMDDCLIKNNSVIQFGKFNTSGDPVLQEGPTLAKEKATVLSAFTAGLSGVLAESMYTPESWALYQTAKGVVESEIAALGSIYAARKYAVAGKITSVLANLVTLESQLAAAKLAAIKQVDDALTEVEADYTEISWTQYQTDIATIKSAINACATIGALESLTYMADLATAKGKLVTLLSIEIGKALLIVEGLMVEEDDELYTSESWDLYLAAVKEITDTIEGFMTISALESYMEDIDELMEIAEELLETFEQETLRLAKESAIEYVNDNKIESKGEYTDESWIEYGKEIAKILKAIDEVEDILEMVDYTEPKLDDLLEKAEKVLETETEKALRVAKALQVKYVNDNKVPEQGAVTNDGWNAYNNEIARIIQLINECVDLTELEDYDDEELDKLLLAAKVYLVEETDFEKAVRLALEYVKSLMEDEEDYTPASWLEYLDAVKVITDAIEAFEEGEEEDLETYMEGVDQLMQDAADNNLVTKLDQAKSDKKDDVDTLMNTFKAGLYTPPYGHPSPVEYTDASWVDFVNAVNSIKSHIDGLGSVGAVEGYDEEAAFNNAKSNELVDLSITVGGQTYVGREHDLYYTDIEELLSDFAGMTFELGTGASEKTETRIILSSSPVLVFWSYEAMKTYGLLKFLQENANNGELAVWMTVNKDGYHTVVLIIHFDNTWMEVGGKAYYGLDNEVDYDTVDEMLDAYMSAKAFMDSEDEWVIYLSGGVSTPVDQDGQDKEYMLNLLKTPGIEGPQNVWLAIKRNGETVVRFIANFENSWIEVEGVTYFGLDNEVDYDTVDEMLDAYMSAKAYLLSTDKWMIYLSGGTPTPVDQDGQDKEFMFNLLRNPLVAGIQNVWMTIEREGVIIVKFVANFDNSWIEFGGEVYYGDDNETDIYDDVEKMIDDFLASIAQFDGESDYYIYLQPALGTEVSEAPQTKEELLALLQVPGLEGIQNTWLTIERNGVIIVRLQVNYDNTAIVIDGQYYYGIDPEKEENNLDYTEKDVEEMIVDCLALLANIGGQLMDSECDLYIYTEPGVSMLASEMDETMLRGFITGLDPDEYDVWVAIKREGWITVALVVIWFVVE